MSNETNVAWPAAEKVLPKSEIVKKLISRKVGLTAIEIGAATAWQPHSVRAYLTGLRKKGLIIAREERRDGSKAYRLLKVTPSASEQ